MADGPLRERLAAGARAHAAGFSWQATAEGLSGAYQRALRMRSQAITLNR
jgi:D-inositol-3-phosphate glycosyltransferase